MNKTSQGTGIPTDIIKKNSVIFGKFLVTSFNNPMRDMLIPTVSKICRSYPPPPPLYKKRKKDQDENYWLVSILPNLSKTIERFLYKQMSSFFDKILSNYKWGFRKGKIMSSRIIFKMGKSNRLWWRFWCFSSLHKKWSFPNFPRISSVDVTKSAGDCRFAHIYLKDS